MLLFLNACINSENSQRKKIQPNKDLYTELSDLSAAYDSTFAKKLESDKYGMKPYVMAFLRRGPNRTQDSVTTAAIQKAHLENITRLSEEGKLVLAGPFTDDGDIRGIFIFNVATVEEARELTASDPAIQAGRLVMELHPWYGSSVLPLIPGLSRRVEKSSVISH
jgi:uncharacterized protein YciI